ncbi:hypothetical protein [Kaistia nematophila]|uniref:Uncharacterized protein n=1 Tax=Kaistia nematophila TaxID=2994654 RepID=A0A9X3IL97_9HYPH|nr:hypothetical protein [Kaistia nematophila]MCX5569627.1 hypothetical protein [Kaistia nematophila]
MTIARIFSNETYERLKGAARDLIGAAGGPRRCQGITRGTESLLSRYGARQEEVFAPIDVIADLEKDAGEPIVTKLLAELSGHLLVPMPTSQSAANWFGHLSGVLTGGSQVEVALSDALADGRIDVNEAKALRAKVLEAMTQMASLGAALDQAIDGAKR